MSSTHHILISEIKQFQLILGEYFAVNREAAEMAEEATDLIGWVLNHGRVHSVFNASQVEVFGKVLAFLVANLTRWGTHFYAFDRLDELKDPMRQAVISRRQDIISAQVGAEKNRQKRQKLEDDANTHCELIDDGSFWRRLKAIVDDLEPICLGINMNQTDAMRPDQALLTFAGIFSYFQKHSKPTVAAGMTTRIEKCWKALDQPMFVLALVLHPIEGISRFGDKAAISPFTLNTVMLDVSLLFYSSRLRLMFVMFRPTATCVLDLRRSHVLKMKRKNTMIQDYGRNEKFPKHF